MVGIGTGPLQPAMDYLANQVIDVPALVDNRSTLYDGVSAFERASRRGTLRTVLNRETEGL